MRICSCFLCACVHSCKCAHTGAREYTVDEAGVVISSMFLSPLTYHSLRAAHSYYRKSQPGQVVIAMMAGRKEIEQDVLAVLFGEEGRGGGAAAEGE